MQKAESKAQSAKGKALEARTREWKAQPKADPPLAEAGSKQHTVESLEPEFQALSSKLLAISSNSRK